MQKTILSLLILPILALGLLWSSDAEALCKYGTVRCIHKKRYRCYHRWGKIGKFPYKFDRWVKEGSCEYCKHGANTYKVNTHHCYNGQNYYCRKGLLEKNWSRSCPRYCKGVGRTRVPLGQTGCMPPSYSPAGFGGYNAKCMIDGKFKKIGGKCCHHNNKAYTHGKAICLPQMSFQHLRCIHGKLKAFGGPCYKTSHYSNLCSHGGVRTKVGQVGCMPLHPSYKRNSGFLGKCLAGGVWKKIGGSNSKCCLSGGKFYKHGQKKCLSPVTHVYLRCINGRFKSYHGYCFQ